MSALTESTIEETDPKEPAPVGGFPRKPAPFRAGESCQPARESVKKTFRVLNPSESAGWVVAEVNEGGGEGV